jgi:hypothetical protein
MRRFARLVLMAGFTILSACASPNVATRAGHGTIESVTQVDRDGARMGNTPSLSGVAGSMVGNPAAGASSSPGAPVGGAAGDTAGPRLAATGRTAYQVTVRMDGGGRQTITQEAVAFKAGDRVRITAEGRLAAP